MGMTQYTTKAHIVRAALEGIAYQTREVKFSLSHFSLQIY
jgi:glycerol kinase